MTIPTEPARLPPEVVETSRLRVRALRAGDGAALARLYAANHERFADSFPTSVAEIVDEAHGESYVASKSAEWGTARGFWFGVWDKGSGALAGQIQLKNLDWSIPKAELAYLIDRSYEGKGLVTEAARALLEIAFGTMGLRKIFLRAIVGNARSAALATRLGFAREGILRKEFRTLSGAIVDLEYYGLLAPEE